MSVDGLVFNAPASRERIASLLERLGIGGRDRVVDVGCGRGEMLAMLVGSTGCTGLGIDPNAKELAVARSRRVERGRLTWCCARIEDRRPDGGFDAAICVGATHAFGSRGDGLPRTLDGLGSLVRDGGRLLVGEGFWVRPPCRDYLAATGFESDDLRTHAENRELGAAHGLELLFAESSSPAEWDRFETAFVDAARARLARAPDDAEAVASLDHWLAWHAAYERWGRHTLGFGFYVFEKQRADGQRGGTRTGTNRVSPRMAPTSPAMMLPAASTVTPSPIAP